MRFSRVKFTHEIVCHIEFPHEIVLAVDANFAPAACLSMPIHKGLYTHTQKARDCVLRYHRGTPCSSRNLGNALARWWTRYVTHQPRKPGSRLDTPALGSPEADQSRKPGNWYVHTSPGDAPSKTLARATTDVTPSSACDPRPRESSGTKFTQRTCMHLGTPSPHARWAQGSINHCCWHSLLLVARLNTREVVDLAPSHGNFGNASNALGSVRMYTPYDLDRPSANCV